MRQKNSDISIYVEFFIKKDNLINFHMSINSFILQIPLKRFETISIVDCLS